MNCYTPDELRRYLLQELPADRQSLIEEHVGCCTICCQTLDKLADDDLVRDYFDATRCAVTQDPLTATSDSIKNDAIRNQEETVREVQPSAAEHTGLPKRFGKFVLKEVLGAGGFGVVYLARDMNLDREVALKMPHLGGLSLRVRQRFLQEGSAAANLHHPHIVQVHQSGVHRGICYLVSEYCPGRTLRRFLNEVHKIGSAREAVRIVLPLAEAVAHAHQNGIVHRDIKPANVILDARGTSDGLPYCPKLTDFGTAKFIGAEHTLTAGDMLIGTLPYMSPEQVSGDAEIGPACDIYALGVLLYETMAGEFPIRGDTNADTIHKIVHSDPPPLHRKLPGIPRDLSAICGRCMEKNPTDRYQSAVELAQDLRRFLNNEPTLARPLGAGPRLLRWSQRNPQPLAIMIAICLSFALLAAGFGWHSARLREVNEQLVYSNRQALAMKERAEASQLQARHLQYTSDIRLAAKCWREGDLRSVREILADYETVKGEIDLRGSEWHFLNRVVQPRGTSLADTGAPLYCVRLSPDQSLIAIGGQDGIIRIYDRLAGTLRRSIVSQQGEVNSVAFSADCQSLASAGDDGTVRMWRISDGKQLGRIEAHRGIAFGVECYADVEDLISCGADGWVRVGKKGHVQAEYQDHTHRVEAIAVSPNGRWFASVGKDRRLFVRDIHSGELQLEWTEGKGTLSSVAFSPDATKIAIGEASGETKSLKLFEVATGEMTWSQQHPDGIRSVAFSPDGTRVLTTDNAGTARIWELSDQRLPSDSQQQPQVLWQAHDSRAYAALFEPDGRSVLTVGHDGRLKRWDTSQTNGQLLLDRSGLADATGLPENSLAIDSLTFLQGGMHIVAATYAGFTIVASEANRQPELQRRPGPRAWQWVAAPRYANWFAVAASSSSQATAAGQFVPAVIERWETISGPHRILFESNGNCSINALSCSPRGNWIAIVLTEQGNDLGPKQLLLLHAETGEITRKLPAASGTKPRFSPDGRYLVFGVQRDIHALDLETAQQRIIRNAHVDSQTGLAVSSDGMWLATCDERNIGIWNLQTLQLHAMLQGHQGLISSLAFSADDRTLLSSSFDGTVKAWSVATGQHLLDLHRGEHGINHLAHSRDSSQLAVVEAKARIRLYDLQPVQP